MSVRYPDTLRQYNHYRKKGGLVVFKYGAEWCGPCKKMAPLVEKLAAKYPNSYFVEVDVDNEEIGEHDDLSNVRSIPHFKFFVDGKLVNEFHGGDSDKLVRYTERYSVKNSSE